MILKEIITLNESLSRLQKGETLNFVNANKSRRLSVVKIGKKFQMTVNGNPGFESEVFGMVYARMEILVHTFQMLLV